MIGLAKKDFEQLEMIRSILSSTHPIVESCDRTGVTMTIGSAKICKRLLEIGLTHTKSYDFESLKVLSHVPQYLMNHFVRGYFDGDGCIGIYRQTHYKDKFIYHFSILGIESMIYELASILNLEHSRISKDNRTVGTYQLITRKFDDIIRIREYMYNDANGIYLNRKHDIFYKI